MTAVMVPSPYYNWIYMKQKKSTLREEMKTKRAALHGADDGSAARLIASQLLMLPEIAGEVQRGIHARRNEPHIVAGFYPIQTEIDALYIMKALNAIQCRCALPVMNEGVEHLTFKEWDLAEDLKNGSYGTREPKSDRVDVMPNIILVPLLAFDSRGNRLGYGGGYYDRTLDMYRRNGHEFTAIGVAFDGQRVDQIPVEEFDQALDIIVTEKKVYRP